MRDTSFFKDKKITVMGFGLHGWGPGVVNWLTGHGAKVLVTDLKSEKELSPMLKKIKRSRVKLVLGRHRESDFKNVDILLQNPGVPRDSKYVSLAKTGGTTVENDASLFLKYCPCAVIGVTGTRGKSTTSALIGELLKSDFPGTKSVGQPQNPMLAVLDKLKANDLAVLELSSWQLEITGEQKISPQVAVITNVYPDHLNRYKGMADYIAAKAQIFLHQKSNDLAILNYDNAVTRKLGAKTPGHRFWFSKKYFAEQNGCFVRSGRIYFRLNGAVEEVAGVNEIKLKGEHNLENILAAVCVAMIFNIKPSAIRKVLRVFSGLPSRLELIREFRGVKYINDTTATTPDGTIAALKTLKKNVILIAGGETKNIPDIKYRQLSALIKKTCKAAVLLEGRGSRQLLRPLKLAKMTTGIKTMPDAVGLARSLSRPGDTILLSPACSSFNLFINEYDRGDQFNRIVKKLK